MTLFEGNVTLSKIYTVDKIVAAEKARGISAKYATNTKTYELIYFVSGGSDTHFAGVDIVDCENSMRYLPKGDYKGVYSVKNIKPGYCIDIYFDTAEPLPDVAIGYHNMDFLRDKFIKIHSVWQEKKIGYYEQAMSIFYDIIRCLKSKKSKYMTSGQRSSIEKAQDYISENYLSRGFDYKELCAVCGFSSYSYFCELFCARYGQTPIKVVTSMKISYATELLIIGRYSIAEIAERCGFENVYYFSNVFKKTVGVSPKNYLKI